MSAEPVASDRSPRGRGIDLSSKKAEFGLLIGSLAKARKSMLSGFMRLALVPTALILALIALIGVPASPGASSLVGALSAMLVIIAAFAVPIMITSWANGLYPKGSLGRFASDLIHAVLLVAALALLLLSSGLQEALSDCGASHRIDWALAIICMMAVFFFARPFFELVDERKPWLRKMGVDVRIAPLNLKGRFLDFCLQTGKLQRGNASSKRSYVSYLVTPTLLLATVYWSLEMLGIDAGNPLLASVDVMFDLVLFFSIIGVILRFMRGFYPAGSYGRATFGFLCIPVLFLFVSVLAFGTGIGEALDDNGLTFDVAALMPIIAIYILFNVVIELSELFDNRRRWHKSIGIEVKPFVPEPKYSKFADFRPRYARFTTGAKRGQKNLGKYAREIFYCVIGTALTLSAIRFLAGTMTSDINGLLPDLNGVTDILGSLATILLIFSIPNTLFIFLQWSYRKGSFSRLVTSEIACLISIIYVFFFWSALANSANMMYNPAFDPTYLNLPGDWLSQAIGEISTTVIGLMNLVGQALTIVMYVLMIVYWSGSIYSAVDAFRIYFRDRKKYLKWREGMLERESGDAKASSVPSAPASEQGTKDAAPLLPPPDQQLPRICEICGREIQPGIPFCAYCGRGNQAEQPPPPPPTN